VKAVDKLTVAPA